MSEFFDAVAGPVGAVVLSSIPERSLNALNGHFPTFHHPGQLPPPLTADGVDWRTWLMIAGRGFGKTRAGAEWVLALVRGEDLSALRIALVGATIDEARAVMVDGPSGLRALAGPKEIAEWSASRRTLVFANGAEATLYSGANPQSLRGPQHHYAWADELAKWKHPEATWDNLQMGLRLGEFPRAVVTTTPQPSALLTRLIDAPDSVRSSGSTMGNPFLPDSFVAAMQAQYGGTRKGLQEIEGRLLDDVEGSLWPLELIERCRVSSPLPFRGGAGGGGCKDSTAVADNPHPSPEGEGLKYTRTVIGVDPPASANGTCGIVVCALGQDGLAYVLADCSLAGASPEGWAKAVADAALRFDADRVVAEKNQGGAMVRSVLLAASATLPIELVHAAVGKSARAEPVALLFENGRAFFAGHFSELEAQLGTMVPGGVYAGNRSPDRADAMVWALWALMLKPKAAPPRISLF